MALLEERGLFWWNDQRIVGDILVPDGAVSGLLTIEDDGRVHLELDGVLPSPTIPMASVLDGMGRRTAKNVQGLLKGSNDYALLVNLTQNGGQSRSHGISFSRYGAEFCLLSQSAFRVDSRHRRQKFRSLRISLKGYEEWLRMGAITVARRRSSLTARYMRVKDIPYRTPVGRLVVEFDMESSGWGKEHNVHLTEFAHLKFTPVAAVTVDEVQKYHQMFQDLMIVLTDSDFNIEWPVLKTANGKQNCRLYFWRNQSTAKAPPAYECFLTYPQVRESFGSLFATWAKMREPYGPAFYLYLGTRRGVKLFIEHRFVNLIWGLEAFDRQVRGQEATPSKLQEKIDRILADTRRSADRRWLKGRLKRAAEPALADRLLALFNRLPVPFKSDSLRIFCEQCAERRNELSHYGGFRPGKLSYDNFIRDLNTKANAIAALYHLLLLTTVGIGATLLDLQSNKSWRAAHMKRHLEAAGLLPPSDKPPTRAA